MPSKSPSATKQTDLPAVSVALDVYVQHRKIRRFALHAIGKKNKPRARAPNGHARDDTLLNGRVQIKVVHQSAKRCALAAGDNQTVHRRKFVNGAHGRGDDFLIDRFYHFKVLGNRALQSQNSNVHINLSTIFVYLRQTQKIKYKLYDPFIA